MSATFSTLRDTARFISRGGVFAWFGLALLTAIVLMAVFAPLIAPYDPLAQDIVNRLMPPSSEFWLGTDSYGRDVLSRIIYGARVSLFVGLVSILIAMTLGTALGVISGYIGGRFDAFVMALVDLMLSFPSLLLGMLVAAVLGASLENLIIAIAITEIAPFVRLARAPTLVLKEQEFVQAARSMGCTHQRIMRIHILPNLIADILVMGSLWMATAIRTEASLSFIGLGVKPPTATWGGMIREGFENILEAWWLAVFPSVFVFLTVLALNLLGDGLRDATDPKLRQRD
ncbi:ABC transporter permease [Bosea sp. Root670]|uniref:ABC transporter permease n=1 Tax=unclassified Bosea (in: a-proteobacteria) TaxID=2653178 RepID=UPI00071355D7|nr:MULTISPECIES: ABC transporter permease [unclassified Bosea (in: a-proteobacteria)]KRE03435.1 ABC transporter permease [Bosea sp. Root670]TQI75368.1 peptide/nickel transport system permease protein [Bosea sp. AK1]